MRNRPYPVLKCTQIDLSKIEAPTKEHVRRILTHYDELLASGECIYGEFKIYGEFSNPLT